MEEMELLNYLSSIEGVSNLRTRESGGRKYVDFIFRNLIEVNVDSEIRFALINVNYKAKLFTNAKIKNAYVQWISKILNYDADTLNATSIVNVGDTHTFNFFLSEELLEKLPIVLNAFIDNFLPSIQPYVKNDFDKAITSNEFDDENEDNNSEKITVKEIYQLLSSIEGITDIGEKRESDNVEFSFLYQNHLQVSLSLEASAREWAYLVFYVEYQAKAFSISKINKKLNDWVLSIITPYDKQGFGALSPSAESYGFFISLYKEMLPALKELLEGFEKDFLPSIQEFLK